MSADNTHTDGSAEEYRLVQYPSRDGSERGPLVQFPGESEMPEQEFHTHAAEAWEQLMEEHVRHTHASGNLGFVDQMAKHIINGDLDQAAQHARAWKAGRSGART